MTDQLGLHVQCDGCGAVGPAVILFDERPRDQAMKDESPRLRERSSSEGWKTVYSLTGSHSDFCPECQRDSRS